MPIAEGVTMRPIRGGDAPPLAAAYAQNSEYLRPWEPARQDQELSQVVLQP